MQHDSIAVKNHRQGCLCYRIECLWGYYSGILYFRGLNYPEERNDVNDSQVIFIWVWSSITDTALQKRAPGNISSIYEYFSPQDFPYLIRVLFSGVHQPR